MAELEYVYLCLNLVALFAFGVRFCIFCFNSAFVFCIYYLTVVFLSIFCLNLAENFASVVQASLYFLQLLVKCDVTFYIYCLNSV